MKLTETQELLINGLRVFEVEKDLIIGIMLLLSKTEQQEEMMEWMAEHEGAKPETLLQIAVEISNSTK